MSVGGSAAGSDNLIVNGDFESGRPPWRLHSDGAHALDVSTGRARIGTTAGMELLAGSEAADATAAGVVSQMEAFAATIRGEPAELPGAAASARATEIAIAAGAAARSGDVISVAP